ncbi:sulfotransferase 1B1-like isoform X1 [Ambystoma mexicanum]|uniref:sulfotransferase 1B1-like isoform X1 n=1 Tax=Ambystoma mexicanum TaxID=8296 RepID=UPI0037E7D739
MHSLLLPLEQKSEVLSHNSGSLLLRMASQPLVDRLELKIIHGVPLIHYFANNFAEVERFQARPDDLLVSTYSKSGTTLLSEILEMLYHDGDTEKCGRDVIVKRVPFIDLAIPGEETGAQLAARTPSPRILKTHLPVQILPKSFWEKNCKIIYVARNAKDVAVSFFHFYLISKVHPEPGTWQEFLDKFMAGKVSYGSWYNHVTDWWEKAQKNPRILYMFYEDMLKDRRREIRKVATFLGKDLDDELLEKTVSHTSFKKMKANPMSNYDGVHPIIVDTSIGPFMRKGVTGDWKNYFTVAQNERFDEDYARQMSGSTLHFCTEA